LPTIPIDFTGVETYANLPEAKYAGSIDKIELREATEEGKFDQLMATYMVTDGDQLGQKSSEFLSLSPAAAFRLKRWFDKFGLADDLEELDVDDDTGLLVAPDLIGIDVIFQVRKDSKPYNGEYPLRTTLVEVLDEEPAPKPAARPARRAAAKAEPEEEAEEAPAKGSKAAKVAAAKAALAALEADDDEDEEEAPAPRRARPSAPARRQAAVEDKPKRRQLR
jgi:hypothetical protein